VFAIKHNTFVQTNTTHVYSINLIAYRIYATSFGLYLGNIQACQHNNITVYRKIRSERIMVADMAATRQ